MQGPVYTNQLVAPVDYGGNPSQSTYRPGASPMYPYDLADFWERVAAYIIDSIIIGIITFPIGFILSYWISGFIESVPPEDMIGSIVWIMLVSSVVNFISEIIYFTLLEGGERNATFGKRLVKIRVMDEHRRPIGMRQAFIRNFGRLTFLPGISSLVLIIDIILILVSDTKQRIGDRMAHTVVVKERPYMPHPSYYHPPYYAQQYYMAQNMPNFQHPPYQPSQPPYQQPPQQGYYQQPPQAPPYRSPPQEKEKKE